MTVVTGRHQNLLEQMYSSLSDRIQSVFDEIEFSES